MKESELITKINELENKLFMIDMVDRWTNKDRELYDKFSKELKEAKEQLKQLKNNPTQKPQGSKQ